MAYFDRFNIKDFKLPNGEIVAVKDIITAIQLPRVLLEDLNLYFNYMMQDGETPEIVSHKMYGTTAYHWVIMIVNGRYDIWEDYPKTDYVLRKKLTNNGVNPDGHHHYEDSNGRTVDEFTYPRIEITNIEYETKINESKRFIKILKPNLLSEFVDAYTKLIEEV